MRTKKLTQEQRIAKLENVSSQAWMMCKMLQKEVGILQGKLKELDDIDVEETI